MTAPKKAQFAAVPIAALGDTRLSASHYRLLATISYHDRMGGNGQGCYALHSTLADRAHVDYTNIARLTRDLRDWGYLSITENPGDKRLKTYRIRFENVGKATNEDVGGTTNENAAQDVGADGENVGENPKERLVKTPENVGEPIRQPVDAVNESGPTKILKKESLRDKKSYEAQIHSAEADPASQATRGPMTPRDVGAYSPAFDDFEQCDKRIQSVQRKVAAEHDAFLANPPKPPETDEEWNEVFKR
jgi:hypothetical protein